MKKIIRSLFVVVMLLQAPFALAEVKVGFVNSDRVMRESAPAKNAQAHLEKEFKSRDQEIQNLANRIQTMQKSLESQVASLSDADRAKKEREISDLNWDFQKKQRQFREDLNQRRNEELDSVLRTANDTIKNIAQAEHFDLIVQDAVYFSPTIDLTDRVIKALNAQK